MPKCGDWHVGQYAWVGPQVMTSNGLELHAVVAIGSRESERRIVSSAAIVTSGLRLWFAQKASV